jgi:hypothetical protein
MEVTVGGFKRTVISAWEISVSIDKLRQLTAKLQDRTQNESAILQGVMPLLAEVVHELANLETMVGAIERRLEKLEDTTRQA